MAVVIAVEAEEEVVQVHPVVAPVRVAVVKVPQVVRVQVHQVVPKVQHLVRVAQAPRVAQVVVQKVQVLQKLHILRAMEQSLQHQLIIRAQHIRILELPHIIIPALITLIITIHR